MTVGSEGMVSLEYLLHRAGPQVYHGDQTKTPYTFGGSRKVGYVDARDVPAFLELREGTAKVFRLAQVESAATVAPPAPAPVVIPETVAVPATMGLDAVGVQATGTVEEPAKPARKTAKTKTKTKSK